LGLYSTAVPRGILVLDWDNRGFMVVEDLSIIRSNRVKMWIVSSGTELDDESMRSMPECAGTVTEEINHSA
jgi:hypothetical protein